MLYSSNYPILAGDFCEIELQALDDDDQMKSRTATSSRIAAAFNEFTSLFVYFRVQGESACRQQPDILDLLNQRRWLDVYKTLTPESRICLFKFSDLLHHLLFSGIDGEAQNVVSPVATIGLYRHYMVGQIQNIPFFSAIRQDVCEAVHYLCSSTLFCDALKARTFFIPSCCLPDACKGPQQGQQQERPPERVSAVHVALAACVSERMFFFLASMFSDCLKDDTEHCAHVFVKLNAIHALHFLIDFYGNTMDSSFLFRVRDKHGNTLLHRAVQYSSDAFVTFLLQQASPIVSLGLCTIRNKHGKTCLDDVLFSKSPKILQTLYTTAQYARYLLGRPYRHWMPFTTLRLTAASTMALWTRLHEYHILPRFDDKVDGLWYDTVSWLEYCEKNRREMEYEEQEEEEVEEEAEEENNQSSSCGKLSVSKKTKTRGKRGFQDSCFSITSRLNANGSGNLYKCEVSCDCVFPCLEQRDEFYGKRGRFLNQVFVKVAFPRHPPACTAMEYQLCSILAAKGCERNVPNVLDLFFDRKGAVCFSMQAFAGKKLKDSYPRGLAPAVRASWIRCVGLQILNVLEVLHELGWIFGNLSGHSLFINGENCAHHPTVMFSDFGYAFLSPAITGKAKVGELEGREEEKCKIFARDLASSEIKSIPEFFFEIPNSQTCAIDMWSFGCLLFSMWTGIELFKKRKEDIFQQVCRM